MIARFWNKDGSWTCDHCGQRIKSPGKKGAVTPVALSAAKVVWVHPSCAKEVHVT